jgi:hypothetical protein
MRKEWIGTEKEGTMRSESAINSPVAVTSLRGSWVGVNSPPSGSPMILEPLYAFSFLVPIYCFFVYISFTL